jgi:hypothetical protein
MKRWQILSLPSTNSKPRRPEARRGAAGITETAARPSRPLTGFASAREPALPFHMIARFPSVLHTRQHNA